MGILGHNKTKSSLSTSPCANIRAAYHNCFNNSIKILAGDMYVAILEPATAGWYGEKFLKGQWDKEECTLEWQKYKECLAEHLDDKHLSRFLEADGLEALANLNSTTTDGVS